MTDSEKLRAYLESRPKWERTYLLNRMALATFSKVGTIRSYIYGQRKGIPELKKQAIEKELGVEIF